MSRAKVTRCGAAHTTRRRRQRCPTTRPSSFATSILCKHHHQHHQAASAATAAAVLPHARCTHRAVAGMPQHQHQQTNSNPLCMAAPPGPPPARRQGLKQVATASAGGSLGAACIPKEPEAVPDSSGTTAAAQHAAALRQLPALAGHMSGGGCVCTVAASQAGAAKKTAQMEHRARVLSLRSAMDHLDGPSCCVAQAQPGGVVTASVLHAPGQLTRGLATRVVRDRQQAQAAKDHNMSSVLRYGSEPY